MNILSIESSCDETAAAIIHGGDNFDTHPTILSNVVVSQIDIFKAYGGVIPEIAARSHLEAILPVIHQAFADAGFTSTDDSGRTQDDWSQIDYIAVTHTPGLLGSLLIGTLTARTLAIIHNKPLYAVHHLKSHVYANWLHSTSNSNSSTTVSAPAPEASPRTTSNSSVDDINSMPQFPLLSLVISGGHTQILYMPSHNQFEIIGTTHDDAIGECFDKVAKILGLPYPGGPAVARAANGEIQSATGETTSVNPGDYTKYTLPHPNVANLDFSFSGLKTAVLRTTQKVVDKPISFPSYELQHLLTNQQKADLAASFQSTAIDILIEKLQKALEQYPAKSIVVAGGVSANQLLRQKMTSTFASSTDAPSVFFPEPRFSGDNAAMVGAAAYYEILSGVAPTDPYSLNIMPRSAIQ